MESLTKEAFISRGIGWVIRDNNLTIREPQTRPEIKFLAGNPVWTKIGAKFIQGQICGFLLKKTG
jgi:hypothetical protein